MAGASIISNHDAQYSTEFPSGYGDFELKSSDNVMFSFPRGVLAHVSPVFKDMFSIGGTSDQREPLALTEDSKVIKEFLLYIDPLKPSLGFTLGTVESLIEAATKYQVATMVETFEKWMVWGSYYIHFHSKSGFVWDGDSPIKKDPMLFLSLAERFDLPDIGSISMRDAVIADNNCVPISKYLLSATTTIQFMGARQERAKILITRLASFIRNEINKFTQK
ncbi:hypothetical protein CPB86DRAFT_870996 [Serendipita vermifera]|nr:hypothetical protein CPB86DRAFT_870996 [Serendipita vermifera]